MKFAPVLCRPAAAAAGGGHAAGAEPAGALAQGGAAPAAALAQGVAGAAPAAAGGAGVVGEPDIFQEEKTASDYFGFYWHILSEE